MDGLSPPAGARRPIRALDEAAVNRIAAGEVV
jgi:DNA mismatch repair ATPase MutL